MNVLGTRAYAKERSMLGISLKDEGNKTKVRIAIQFATKLKWKFAGNVAGMKTRWCYISLETIYIEDIEKA